MEIDNITNLQTISTASPMSRTTRHVMMVPNLPNSLIKSSTVNTSEYQLRPVWVSKNSGDKDQWGPLRTTWHTWWYDKRVIHIIACTWHIHSPSLVEWLSLATIIVASARPASDELGLSGVHSTMEEIQPTYYTSSRMDLQSDLRALTIP